MREPPVGAIATPAAPGTSLSSARPRTAGGRCSTSTSTPTRRTSSTRSPTTRTAARRPRRSLATTSSPSPAPRPPRDRRQATPYLSKEDPMPAATDAPTRHRASDDRDGLRCRVRLADGRVFSGPLGPERHRALQLGVLHEHSAGLVELAGGARRDGRLQITTRRRPDHFLPGERAGEVGWMERLLALAAGTPTPARRCSSRRPSARRHEATTRGQRDPLPVGRRRRARRAAGARGCSLPSGLAIC